ncbi:hypothetical protein [Nocardia otitidiscaviarum]|uniref:hypothetical protein n=1 Tax=Nocardia otitidiscaviarum TaxID=1823 RepID=UPI0011DE04C3|nr:hypothetical protein [Nocardia otitidiscaviarum]
MVGFNYDYWMNCECGQRSLVTAAHYHEQSTVDALAPCQHCGRDIHYGTYVTAIRDTADPSLSNEAVNTLAWYHTSTQADWPSSSFAQTRAKELQSLREILPGQLDSIVDRETTLALHVGTYEAAIENMLRRMRYQDDHDRTFYLHRVTLRLKPNEIEPGYRDENDAPASRLSVNDLRSADYLAVRYLNVHESPGSLSLAIDPTAIEAIQSVALPPPGVVPDARPTVPSKLAPLQIALDTAMRAVEERTEHLNRLPDNDAVLNDDEAVEKLIGPNRSSVYEVWHYVGQILSEEYLPGINPVVRENFISAIDRWREHTSPSVDSYHRKFSQLALLLTRQSDIAGGASLAPTRRFAP